MQVTVLPGSLRIGIIGLNGLAAQLPSAVEIITDPAVVLAVEEEFLIRVIELAAVTDRDQALQAVGLAHATGNTLLVCDERSRELLVAPISCACGCRDATVSDQTYLLGSLLALVGDTLNENKIAEAVAEKITAQTNDETSMLPGIIQRWGMRIRMFLGGGAKVSIDPDAEEQQPAEQPESATA